MLEFVTKIAGIGLIILTGFLFHSLLNTIEIYRQSLPNLSMFTYYLILGSLVIATLFPKIPSKVIEMVDDKNAD